MPLENELADDSEAITKVKQVLKGFSTKEGRLKGFDYQPRPNDVAINTTAKAGTTWMQQICHQLRSGGDMDFDEIGEVVPWIELAADQGQDLEAPQYGHDEPHALRLFKTHIWADHFPPFPKTIVVLRNPYDVVVSFYHFFENWVFDEGTIPFEAFAQNFWLARDVPASRMQNASYFVHLTSWWKRRHSNGVLMLCFEDLKENYEREVRRVAAFLSTDGDGGIYQSEERIQIALERSSFKYMKEHADKFDGKLIKIWRNEAAGLPKDAGMGKSKVRSGAAGKGRAAMTESLRAKIQQKWTDVVEPVTGCATYEELRQKLHTEEQPKS